MNDKKEKIIILPVGRLVGGSLYEGQTTNAVGQPYPPFKTGPDAGKQRLNFFFAVAIKKEAETHFSQTPWGKQIWDEAHALWPRGQAERTDFAWKIIDGDDETPNEEGYRLCDREGYAGHWVLRLSSSYISPIWDKSAVRHLPRDEVEITPGDYIHVGICVARNQKEETSINTGVMLNHKLICFVDRGEPIVFAAVADPKALGMGNAALPPTAKPYVPTSAISKVVENNPPTPVKVVPHEKIITPRKAPPMPTPVSSGRKMTALAEGHTYEQLKQVGWSDEQLISEGLMSE